MLRSRVCSPPAHVALRERADVPAVPVRASRPIHSNFQLTLKKLQFLYFIGMRNFPVERSAIFGTGPARGQFFFALSRRLLRCAFVLPFSDRLRSRIGAVATSVLFAFDAPSKRIPPFFKRLPKPQRHAIGKTGVETRKNVLGVRHRGFPSHH